MSQHMIELRRVSKFYASHDTVSAGFSRIDLTLDIGEFVAITGESGSGKSTLLNVISGLDTYEEGEMYVGGLDTSAFQTEDYEKYRKTYIGNIFQDFNLVNSYTVYQNVELSMLLNGRKKGECRDEIMRLLDKVGLREYANAKASKLSGGQKQRVAIARALAKDSPIIVADEPTGNLDSKSAMSVMKTLKDISANKLVVIVTHNYEQAEPYVTRKITMHDGKITEDKVIDPEAAIPFDEVNTGTKHAGADDDSDEIDSTPVSFASQMLLGLRNTFNIPVKFILLLIVYLFVTAAVVNQYSATKNALHQTDLLGYNQYFEDAAPDRLVVTRSDKQPLSDSDVTKLKHNKYVRNVETNDLSLDKGAAINTDEIYMYGPVLPVSGSHKPDVGNLPKNDNEVMVSVKTSSTAYRDVRRAAKSWIGKDFTLEKENLENDDVTKLLPNKVKISGVDFVSDDGSPSASESQIVTFYTTENTSRLIRSGYIADLSRTNADYNGRSLKQSSGQVIYPSDSVPAGQAYISENQAAYYDNGAALNKPLKITISNVHYSKQMDLTVGKVFSQNNINSLLGLNRDDYDSVSSRIYMNTGDFESLCDPGAYQVSVFLNNEHDASAAAANLKNEGFSSFVVGKSLTDATGGFAFVIKLFNRALLIIEFIVLFFIAYAVIRLIMKSRNSYYSTLRILGASRSNTDNILRIELLTIMVISYLINLVFVRLIKNKVINWHTVRSNLAFLTTGDYILLFAALILMSFLIARRYSRKIFGRSAMKVYREGE